MIQFEIAPTEDGKMLKKVLQNRFQFSRRMFRRLREEGRVMVNNQFLYYTARVSVGDQVTVDLQDTSDDNYIKPEDIPLTIVYEDDDLLILDKHSGIVVHPTLGYSSGTLANGVAHYAKKRGESYPFRPVTRLDKDTSGIMVVAKHAHAHAFLSKQMKQKRYKRKYIAICHGKIEKESGTINLPIGSHPDSIILRVIDQEYGKPAITHYQIVEKFSNATMLSLTLETGRTHQIRVHLAAIGHAIIGDTLYGSIHDTELITHQALHAKEITLFHQHLRQWMNWEIPLPSDMLNLLKKLQ